MMSKLARFPLPEEERAGRDLGLAENLCKKLDLGAAQRSKERDLSDECNPVSLH